MVLKICGVKKFNAPTKPLHAPSHAIANRAARHNLSNLIARACYSNWLSFGGQREASYENCRPHCCYSSLRLIP